MSRTVRCHGGETLTKPCHAESGQDLAEYAILTALIVLVVIGILSLVGDRIAAFYESVVGVLPFGS